MMHRQQISDNEIYLLIKYTKSVLWRVVKRLFYIEEARCLKVKLHGHLGLKMTGLEFGSVNFYTQFQC